MDDYAKYLAEEAQSDVAALHQFRILYDPSSKAFHFFFEGEEDSLYYMPEARRFLTGKPAHIYDCGGKKNVVDVRDAISADGYNLDCCLFFIDRDYDDYLSSQPLIDAATYVTDNYSIENDVATSAGADILLGDIIRLSRADPEYANISNRMNEAYSKFCVEVRPLVAWIIAAKESGCGPNLNNTNGLKGIVKVGSAGMPELTRAGFISFKKKTLGGRAGPPLRSVVEWRRKLSLFDHKKWIRGKYDVWFFQVSLVSIIEESSARRKAAGGRVIRIPSSIREGRIFEVLGGRTPVPPSLQTFLGSRLH